MARREKMTQKIQGVASKVSPLVPDLLAQDPSSNEALSADGNYMPEGVNIDVSRYISEDFAELEKEKIWKKSWQYAARVEDIPKVGDRTEYTVSGLSCFIVRGDDDEIRAYLNSCPHRGTKLCVGFASSDEVVCPFHGWKWNLDGKIKGIPSEWDFQNYDKDDVGLIEIKCEVWQGYIFINFDDNAKPLDKSLGVLKSHFATMPERNQVTIVRIKKVIKANWKVAMEAFLESYHTVETHPQLLTTLADASTKYDVWDDGDSSVSRLYSPIGVPSPHLGDDVDLGECAKEYAKGMEMPGMEHLNFIFKNHSEVAPRNQLAEWRRSIFKEALGVNLDGVADAALLDAIQYWMFPNFCPWYGEGIPIAYQFLPVKGKTNECVMEVRLLAPLPDGEPLPDVPAQIDYLDASDSFAEKATGFGGLAMVFDQDMINIPVIQEGLENAYHLNKSKVRLADYQEQRIAHFHEVLDRWVAK
jgi:phenylpropionate dioxygenase-like ring-hydroxylating dioxygenase large terminal subunit